MGMAASQARLLSITARMHDIEYKAQSIQNEKIQLATQSDQVYNEYLNALNADTLTIKNINGDIVPANFNNIRGMNATLSATGKAYALRNKDGLLIVSQEEKDAYDSYKENTDPYLFALSLIMGNTNNLPSKDVEDNVLDKFKDSEANEDTDLFKKKKRMEDMLKGRDVSELDDKEKKIYQNLEKEFRYGLYKNHGDDILHYIDNSKDENDEYLTKFDNEKFEYYTNLYKQIQAAGGCISIHDKQFAVLDSEESISNSSDWLKRMVQAGLITIEVVNTDKKGDVIFNTTSPSSDANLQYTQTSSIDKKELAIAEAKYEHDTKKIEQKDKKFDMDLSKLETERTALKTEYDSVKKVINDNIERTFGIFS